jgi:hypothetical protein
LLLAAGVSGAYAQNTPEEGAKTEAASTGAFKAENGTCEAAYFKSTGTTKTVRGEEAMGVTIVNSGTTVNGQLVLRGAREGQIVSPMDDKAMFLFEPLEGDKIHVIPIGGPAAGWPEVNLDLCPGSRS